MKRNLFVLLCLAVLSLAPVAVMAGGGTFFTFTQPLYGGTTISLSAEGNVVGFNSPTGSEHIAVGSTAEGYVLCYNAVNAYDNVTFQSGFAAAAPSCAGNSCTITRDTSDGILRLTQLIQFADETNSLVISMRVTNLSGSTVNSIVLRRHADFDIDNSLPNFFAATSENGVTAWNEGGHSMTLRNAVGPVTVAPHLAKLTWWGDTSCSPVGTASPMTPLAGSVGGVGTDGPGDAAASIEYNIGSLAAGQSTSVTVRYTRR